MSVASKSSPPDPDGAGPALSSGDPPPPTAPAHSHEGTPTHIVHTDGGDYAAGDIDRRPEGSVSVSGGTISGPVMGINQGVVVNYYKMVIGRPGTILNDGPVSEVKVLNRVLLLPRQSHTFYDRTDIIGSLQSEIRPGGGVWLHGARGCGLSMLLRKTANLPVAGTLPNGAIYLDGTLEPADRDEILRRLYIAYNLSDVPIAIHPAVARGFLSGLQALFVFDALSLSHSELVNLADTLRGSAVLIAAEGPAPTTLEDVSLGGLPRQDAIQLCSSVSQIDGSEPDLAPLLDQLCAALDDLSLPLVLIGQLLRARGATPAQVVARLDELIDSSAPAEHAIGQPVATTTGDGPASVREPLTLAVQLSLETLSSDECAVLTVLAHTGQHGIELAALAAASQLTAAAIEPALMRLMDLGLATSGNERYQVSTSSVGHVVKQLLPAGDERRRAAAFYASAASARAGGRHAGSGDTASAGARWAVEHLEPDY